MWCDVMLRSAMSSNTLNNRLFSTIQTVQQRIDEVSALDVAKEFVEVNGHAAWDVLRTLWLTNEWTSMYLWLVLCTVSPSHNYNDNYTRHTGYWTGFTASLSTAFRHVLKLSTTVQHFHIFIGVNIDHFTDLLRLALLFFLFSFVMQRIILSLCGCNWNK